MEQEQLFRQNWWTHRADGARRLAIMLPVGGRALRRFIDGGIFGDMSSIDITGLTSEERLRLLEALWESLSLTPEAVPLSDAQREELDRRLDEIDREGPVGIPWEEVLGRIRSPTV